MVTKPGKKAPRFDPEYQNKLIRMLGYYKRLTEKIGYGGELEWKFDLDMDGHNRKMTGFIDRMIRKDDEFFLLDYKTTKTGGWRKNERTIGQDLQLMCYCYVVMNTFKVPAKNIRAALFYLDDNKLIPTTFSEEQLLSVPEKLLARYKEIESLDPDKVHGNTGRHCHRCDYRTLCQFWKLT
jgi:RecB family exonuclease